VKWLAQYLREVFCRHSWKTEEARFTYVFGGGETVRVSATCEKCGYHRVYDKWARS
jgi:hypothetical protein